MHFDFLQPEGQTAAVLRNVLGFTAFSAFSMIINRKSGSEEEAYRLVSLETHYGLKICASTEQRDRDDKEIKVVACLIAYG